MLILADEIESIHLNLNPTVDDELLKELACEDAVAIDDEVRVEVFLRHSRSPIRS